MSRHKHINTNHRRHFLRKMIGAGCASLSLSPFLSTITNLNLLNAAASANRPIYTGFNSSDYKALVCIMLSGGNDSFNMLIPSGDDADFGSEYQEYVAARSNMKLEQSSPNSVGLNDRILNPLSNDSLNRQFSVHPNMPKVQSLFNGTDTNPAGDRHLSFITNVGTLTEAGLDSTTYANGTKSKPYQLFSHSDQAKSWQTGIAEGFGTRGWGGRIADLLHENNNDTSVSMNIALNDVNVFQRGDTITEYVIQSITDGGSVKLYDSDSSIFYDSMKMATTDNILNVQHKNILEKAYGNEIRKAKANSNIFYTKISNTTLTTSFPDTSLGNQLKMVAKTICNRDNIGGTFKNQTFFVNLKDFDNHSELLEKHSSLMKHLDDALYSFYEALVEMGMLNQVTTFTMSDFARTLRSNGDGTDHAWGGHHFVMGGAVDGGKIFGEYPRLDGSSIYDIGHGRFIPTISCDEYFADLALWFGAEANDLYDILPNIDKFWTPTGTSGPLGLFV